MMHIFYKQIYIEWPHSRMFQGQEGEHDLKREGGKQIVCFPRVIRLTPTHTSHMGTLSARRVLHLAQRHPGNKE